MSARTGAALKHATVQLRQVGGGVSKKQTTAAGGRFLFPDVGVGKYRLSAARRGYVSQEFGSLGPGWPGETLVVEAGGQFAPVVIRLSPEGAIAGRVVDEDGEPVADVNVQALQAPPSRGGGRLVEAKLARTNDLGEYRIFGLPPGRYYISAEYPIWERPDERAGGTTYAPTYYPGTVDPSAAMPLDAAPGSESLGIDFALVRAQTVRVRGRVTNVSGSLGQQGVSVVLMPRGLSWVRGSLMKSASVDERTGNFEIPEVVPGSYVVAAYTVGDGQRKTGSQGVDVGTGDLDGISVELSAGTDIRGSVQMEGQSQRSWGGLSVNLRPRIPLPTGGVSGRFAPDGTVRIAGVPSAEYDIELSGVPDGCYVKSVQLGGADVIERGVELDAARASGELLVILGADGGRVEGHVSNERQEVAPSAYVVLVPREVGRRTKRRLRSKTADQNGRFQLSGIEPGEYRAFAWEERDEVDYASPQFASHYESKGTDVTVPANGQASVQLRTID